MFQEPLPAGQFLLGEWVRLWGRDPELPLPVPAHGAGLGGRVRVGPHLGAELTATVHRAGGERERG